MPVTITSRKAERVPMCSIGPSSKEEGVRRKSAQGGANIQLWREDDGRQTGETLPTRIKAMSFESPLLGLIFWDDHSALNDDWALTRSNSNTHAVTAPPQQLEYYTCHFENKG
jgi:hypothetical protein